TVFAAPLLPAGKLAQSRHLLRSKFFQLLPWLPSGRLRQKPVLHLPVPADCRIPHSNKTSNFAESLTDRDQGTSSDPDNRDPIQILPRHSPALHQVQGELKTEPLLTRQSILPDSLPIVPSDRHPYFYRFHCHHQAFPVSLR